MELGSLAEFISAFGTLAALVAAGIAARAAIRTNNQQAEQLRQLEAGERRREAELEQRDAATVAFWTALTTDGPGVRYTNLSGLPIYDLLIRVLIPGRTVVVDYLSLGPSTRDRGLNRVGRALAAVAVEDGPVDWAGLLTAGTFRCAAMFRDTSGRWWVRDVDGQLHARPDRESALRELDDART